MPHTLGRFLYCRYCRSNSKVRELARRAFYLTRVPTAFHQVIGHRLQSHHFVSESIQA